MKLKLIKKEAFTMALSISLGVGLSLLGLAVFKMSQNFNNNIQSYNIKSNSDLKANANFNNFVNQWGLKPLTDISSDDFPIKWDKNDESENKIDMSKDVVDFKFLADTIDNSSMGNDISEEGVKRNKVKIFKLIVEGKDRDTDKIRTQIESIIKYQE
jgi:hypothetical protein